MGKKTCKIYTWGPRKNAIFRGYAPRKDTRHAVGAVKLKNILNNNLKHLLYDIILKLIKN